VNSDPVFWCCAYCRTTSSTLDREPVPARIIYTEFNGCCSLFLCSSCSELLVAQITAGRVKERHYQNVVKEKHNK